MPEQAPKYRTNRSADKAKSFTTAQVNAVTTLDNIAGKFPPFPPQRVTLHNNAPAALSVVTLTLEDGTDFVVELALNETADVPVPIKAFKTAAPATVTARCYWWFVAQQDETMRSYNLNA